MPTVVAIGGPPGSGKTTVAELLAERRGVRLISAGKLFRKMARDRGLSLEEFGDIASQDHTIDVELDREVAAEVKALVAAGQDVVVEGRLQAVLLERESVRAVKVWLDAPLDVRVKRISGRESEPQEAVQKEVEQRQAQEARRYTEIYGIDQEDVSVYDLVMDTTDLSPSEVVDAIVLEVGS